MHVGVCRVNLRLPENQGLKGKRQVSKSIISKVRTRYNVGIAEVEDNDLWQRLTLGFCCVSNNSRHANEMLSEVVQFIQDAREDVEFLDYEIELIPGI